MIAGVGRHGESEAVAIERQGTVEIGDAQVHVADANGRVDGFVVHAAQCPAGATHPHRWKYLTASRER